MALLDNKIFKVCGIILAISMFLVLGYYFIPGKVSVTTNIPFAAVSIDYSETGKSISYLRRGPHIITVSADGYASTTQNIIIFPLQSLHINLTLLKSTNLVANDVSDTAEPVDQQIFVQSALQENYPYLNLDSKTIEVLSGGKSAIYLALNLPTGSDILRFKWSNNHQKLFIRAVDGDAFSSFLVTIADKSLKPLDQNISDAAFVGEDFYYLINGANSKSITKNGQEYVTISSPKNNLEIFNNNIVLYDTILDGNSSDVSICPDGKNCRQVTLDGDIYQLVSDGQHLMAITIANTYKLYDLTSNTPKLISDAVSPAFYLDKSFFYQQQKGNCDITEYDFNTSVSIYSNSDICDIGDFAVRDSAIYILNGLTGYKLSE